MFELKPMSRGAVESALEKAMRYRLLNEPVQAESICLDILEVDPDNDRALITLLLALTDQFSVRPAAACRDARSILPRLQGDYHRIYYEGIICERRAKAMHDKGGPIAGFQAYAGFREAMECYEKAIELRPAEDDEAVLRWNTCARMIERHPELKPAPEDTFQPMLE